LSERTLVIVGKCGGVAECPGEVLGEKKEYYSLRLGHSERKRKGNICFGLATAKVKKKGTRRNPFGLATGNPGGDRGVDGRGEGVGWR
jgi:hypothetical protein